FVVHLDGWLAGVKHVLERDLIEQLSHAGSSTSPRLSDHRVVDLHGDSFFINNRKRQLVPPPGRAVSELLQGHLLLILPPLVLLQGASRRSWNLGRVLIGRPNVHRLRLSYPRQVDPIDAREPGLNVFREHLNPECAIEDDARWPREIHET